MNLKFFYILSSFFLLTACVNNEIPSDLKLSNNNSSIIGGHSATAQDPWTSSTVSLITHYNNRAYSTCTGTLISKNLVLTATHCLEYMGEGLVYVYLGAKLPKKFDNRKLLKVKKWITHPDFKMVLDENEYPITGVNDVALIRLEKTAPATATPVPILNSKVPLSRGQSLLLAGYGLVQEIDTPIDAEGLNYVRVPLAKVWNSILVTDQTNAQGACSGDSGGPAYLETKKGLIVVGITRGPHDKATDCRHYGEYTNASHFESFILDAARELEAEAPEFVDQPKNL